MCELKASENFMTHRENVKNVTDQLSSELIFSNIQPKFILHTCCASSCIIKVKNYLENNIFQ